MLHFYSFKQTNKQNIENNNREYFIAKIDPKLCSMTHTWKYLTNKYACDIACFIENIYF